MLSIALNVSLGFGVYLLLQGPLLRSSGQAWGKRIFGIYIVDMSSPETRVLETRLRA